MSIATATTTIRRTCERCGSIKVAKYPKGNPHFCTMACAAEHACENTRYEWCDKHGGWNHEDDGCYDCEKEERDNA